MTIWDSLAGFVRVRITSADPEKLLDTLSSRGVRFFDIAADDDLSCTAVIRRTDFKMLRNYAENFGAETVVADKLGLYWIFPPLFKRPILLIGLAVYLVALLFLPTRILFIQVEGNPTVSTAQILNVAHDCGIYFGAPRRSVRSEVFKNKLLQKIPALQWSGVNTKGCVATISVTEKTKRRNDNITNENMGIFASRDAIVRSVTVQKGNPLCAPGLAVRKGQLLISGYTDCGLVLRATGADGEVYGDTMRKLRAVTLKDCLQRAGEGQKVYLFGILVGKKQINFFDSSRIFTTTCVKMYKEYFLTLPGGFRLPVALIVHTAISYPDSFVTETEDVSWVPDVMDQYLRCQMVAGQILKKVGSSRYTEDVYTEYAEYACREMISQAMVEEITNHYGKTD